LARRLGSGIGGGTTFFARGFGCADAACLLATFFADGFFATKLFRSRAD
jgi:hypothetical protein